MLTIRSLRSRLKQCRRGASAALGAGAMLAVLVPGPAEVSGAALLSLTSVVLSVATPARANCLIGGENRADIADDDCLEAQRTGCVRNMLNAVQYKSCLAENKKAKDAGLLCVIGGKVRREFSDLDCEEAKATGCVRRLLTKAQYVACLDAQP